MREGGPQRLGAAADAGHRLAIRLLDVILDRHGRRADVGALLHRILSAAPAQFGQHEAIADAADQVAPLHLDAFFVLEELERFLDDLERQADVAGQVQAEHDPLHVKGAQEQVVEEVQAETGLLEAIRGRGRVGNADAVPIRVRRTLLVCDHASILWRTQERRKQTRGAALSRESYLYHQINAQPTATKTREIWIMRARSAANS